MTKKKKETVVIDGLYYRVSAKTGRASKVPLTRCSNTKTEAEFRNWILNSGFRNLTKRWKPAADAWKINRRNNTSGVGKHRIEHQCVNCKVWGPKKSKVIKWGIELDHIVPIGGMSSFDKIPVWIERGFVEIYGYQKLCTTCHAKKTKEEKIKCK